MTTDVITPFQTAGSIDLQTLDIVSSSGKFVNVFDYMAEINIYEDMFSPFMYGTLTMVDSRNLIKDIPIIGDEYLVVKFKTPSTDAFISKTFRIFSVTDREIVTDLNTQTYNLHFISKEAVLDSLSPIYKSFSGKISDVVKNIFKDYLSTYRTLDKSKNELKIGEEKSSLVVFPETQNSVKFISPGWTPARCISWCASKAMPSEGEACNYLFFESNKTFNFINIEKIFEFNLNANTINLGKYYYKVNNVDQNNDPVKKMFIAEDFQVLKTTDHLSNYDNGYLANRLITLDVINKKYEFYDYDHVEKFSKYKHSQGEKSIPLFAPDTPRNPTTSIRFHPIHPGLHTIPNNIDEKMPVVYGNRLSNLLELSNFKITINVPGRTDAEVGAMLYFSFPDVSPKDETDTSKNNEDKYYSGHYIITAIHHKINLTKHTMTMELVKDSLNNR